MATSLTSHQQSIEELVTCPICMERMERPKHLNCQHAFCMDCLGDWTRQPGNTPRSISCPVCRKVTQVESGVHNLPNDINVVRLIDVLNTTMETCSVNTTVNSPNTASSSQKCSNDKSPAVAYCETCLDHLCTQCLKNHKQEPALANHFIKSTLYNCPVHPKKSLELFCPRCKKMVCNACVHGPHKKHGVQPIAVVAKRNKDVIRKLRKTLSDKVMVHRKQISQTGTDEGIEMALAELESLIENQAAKSRRAVESWQQGILGEVTKKKDEYRQMMSKGENHLVVCESLLTYADNFLQPDVSREVVSSFLNVRDRMNQAEKTLDSLDVSTSEQKIKEFIFVPANMPHSLGQLTTTAEQEKEQITLRTESSSSSMESSQSPLLSPAGGPVLYPNLRPDNGFTAATAPDLLSMTSQNVPQLVKHGLDLMDESWCNTDFSFTKKMHNEESLGTSFGQAAVGFIQWASGSKEEDAFAPVDVAIDSNRGFMYIIDRGWFTAGSVRRYSFPGDQMMRYPTLVMNELSAYILGVCQRDGTIAASVKEMIYTHSRGVIPEKRKAPDLIPVEKVFPHTVRSPRGMAITDDNTWVIVDTIYSVIAMYKLEGSVKEFKHIITFGSRGSLPGQFQSPTYVCCDPVRDRIIVADSGNHRVQAFSMKGDFLWAKGSKGTDHGDFNTPHGVCMDGAGNILVADTGNKRIEILSWRDGQYLKSISTNVPSLNNLSPYNVALYSPMHSNEAFVVIAGLHGRMPVISMLKYSKDYHGVGRSSSRSFVFVDHGRSGFAFDENYDEDYDDW